ncbi:serine hydrolase [Candidatus Saccharibacteria bacterium]|nr:serine hydrolase [Candidatus Saccharibacteria bacterium]
MVSKSTRRSETIAICLIILAFAVISGGIFLLNPDNNASAPKIAVKTEAEEEKEEQLPEITEASKLPDAIDFQSTIDDWAGSIGGNKSVVIYDLERGEISAEYNALEDYNTASLYKLFVAYEGYRRVFNGTWSSEAFAGSTGRTILECLDLAIRESNSPCAETLWNMIGHTELDSIVRSDFLITNSNISSLISNASDIAKMMKIFYEHKEIADETLVARMIDSFLNQPITTYNWRQGLPSGFSRARVYNKVGWDYNPNGGYWNIYHDAAIVEFPEENRHFIVVVMTNRVPFQKIKELGTLLEDVFYSRF